MNITSKAEIEMMVKMPFDWEIMGRLYYQARELMVVYDFIYPKSVEKENFMTILLDVSIKISAMKYHMKNYENHEFNCIEQLKSNYVSNNQTSIQADILLFEVEAFMFQMKSALDYSVKLIGTFYPNRFRVQTFGDKGDELIKGLRQFAKDKKAKKHIVDAIIEMISEDQKSWLKQAINLRDKLSHYKTVAGYCYQCKREGGELKIITPRIARLNALTYMQTTYSNCLEFIQDYMCLVIGLILPKTFSVGVRDSSIPASVGEPLGQFIKWGLGTPVNSTE